MITIGLLSPVVSGFLVCLLATAATAQIRDPDAPYAPTPERVVQEMLEIAGVDSTDIVYDLGSGDGRIVIAAAARFGARGVGIEIDPELVRQAADDAERGGVAHLVRFLEGDFFAADLREATVVTLYLLPEVNRRLLPKLLAELRPGTRIVSYRYPLGDWPPDKTVRVSRGTVYVWVVPSGAAPGRQDEGRMPPLGVVRAHEGSPVPADLFSPRTSGRITYGSIPSEGIL